MAGVEIMINTIKRNSLLTKSDIKVDNSLPSWFIKEFKTFDEIVSKKDFVCHFGTMAHKKEELLFSYIDEKETHLLPNKLSDFLKISKNNPDKRHAWIVFVKPNKQFNDFDYSNKYFWNMLNYLHSQDSMDWPKDWPVDPEDPNWEFIYNQEPIFVSVNGPFYKNRITRNLGNSLIIIFQPRRIFKDISHKTTVGKKAISLIRSKVEKQENLPIHPDLGSYGDLDKREWKQYLITDDEIGANNLKCPFRF